MTQALTTNPNSDVIESVITAGDLSKLNPVQRVNYYTAVCQSVGLNPLTKPFEYITLNGKMVLYARKDATDQLRDIRKVSVTRLERERIDGVYVVTAYAQAQDGRTDSSMGAVSIEGLKGDSLANALMKAETKAKRRVTLSICGLGMLDETELSTIPDARPANVNVTTGEVIDAPRTITVERPSAGPAWTPDAANDAAFETLPSASAERAGNGKAPASGAKHDPARAWDDERKDEAVAWAMRRYPEIFEAKPHARKSLDKLIRELGQDGTVNTPPDTIARAWKEKCAAKQDELDAKKLQATLDAQAAGEEMPVFESR
jgi:hypothetical protein